MGGFTGCVVVGLTDGEALALMGLEVGIRDGLPDWAVPALRTNVGNKLTFPKPAAQPAKMVTEPEAGITKLAVNVVESIPIYLLINGVAATLEFAPPAVQAVPPLNVAPPNI